MRKITAVLTAIVVGALLWSPTAKAQQYPDPTFELTVHTYVECTTETTWDAVYVVRATEPTGYPLMVAGEEVWDGGYISLRVPYTTDITVSDSYVIEGVWYEPGTSGIRATDQVIVDPIMGPLGCELPVEMPCNTAPNGCLPECPDGTQPDNATGECPQPPTTTTPGAVCYEGGVPPDCNDGEVNPPRSTTTTSPNPLPCDQHPDGCEPPCDGELIGPGDCQTTTSTTVDDGVVGTPDGGATTSSTQAAPSGTLPATGSSGTGTSSLVALVAVVFGTILVMVARRRPSPQL